MPRRDCRGLGRLGVSDDSDARADRVADPRPPIRSRPDHDPITYRSRSGPGHDPVAASAPAAYPGGRRGEPLGGASRGQPESPAHWPGPGGGRVPLARGGGALTGGPGVGPGRGGAGARSESESPGRPGPGDSAPPPAASPARPTLLTGPQAGPGTRSRARQPVPEPGGGGARPALPWSPSRGPAPPAGRTGPASPPLHRHHLFRRSQAPAQGSGWLTAACGHSVGRAHLSLSLHLSLSQRKSAHGPACCYDCRRDAVLRACLN
jgi:hypothetical protein